MPNYLMTFDIKSDWHIGSGKEGGAYADALCLKDNAGLPYIPGKSCKGLLRDAFQLAANSEWFEEEMVYHFFGVEDREGQTQQGMLQISSARLSNEEAHYIVSNNATKHLYRVLQSTAIDHQTGTAQNASLRSIEVAVPMQLSANVRLNSSHPDFTNELEQQFYAVLSDVVCLISEFGSKRHRGLGQVTVTVKEA